MKFKMPSLWVQVMLAIVAAVAFGFYDAKDAMLMKPLGDVFVNAIKMVIVPIVFLSIVTGIAHLGDDLKRVGRIGFKALIYFEVVTTIALGLGLAAVNIVKPGAGIGHAVTASAEVGKFVETAQKQTLTDFLVNIVPANIFSALDKGDMLPILFFAVLFGLSVAAMGEAGKPLVRVLDLASKAVFGVIGIVVKAAPIGAFGAMSFTIGKYGIASIVSLAYLVGTVYATMIAFILVVLGLVARVYGFRILKLISYLKEELLIVLGTSSSESVLPQVMAKLRKLGCGDGVVGLVVPTGYSFNLDGTAIYLSAAAIFIAQAYGIDLSIGQQLSILAVLMLTSKGAAAVTGGGFVCLAATLTATGVLPVEGLALLLGVDKFMSEARALTNLVGNSVATIVIAKSEGEFDGDVGNKIIG